MGLDDIQPLFVLADAEGGRAAARRVAFLRKKLRKNLFGKRFFVAQWGGCEHSPPMPEGARPVFAGGKDRSSRGLSLRGPFIFGRKESGVNKILVVS